MWDRNKQPLCCVFFIKVNKSDGSADGRVCAAQLIVIFISDTYAFILFGRSSSSSLKHSFVLVFLIFTRTIKAFRFLTRLWRFPLRCRFFLLNFLWSVDRKQLWPLVGEELSSPCRRWNEKGAIPILASRWQRCIACCCPTGRIFTVGASAGVQLLWVALFVLLKLHIQISDHFSPLTANVFTPNYSFCFWYLH